MSERASYFKLGVFVIATTAITLIGVSVLGAGALFRHTFPAETYMEESVQGLDVGAPVKHRGVPVGKVSRITFVGDKYDLPPAADGMLNRKAGYVLVEMELDATSRGMDESIATIVSAIKGGMHARMASSGLVGTVYVDMFFPPAGQQDLELEWEPESLYIPSAKSVIAELTETASRIAKQLEDADLDVVGKDIGRLMKSVEEKVSALDVAMLQSDAKALIDELRASNHRVQQILNDESIGLMLRDAQEAVATVKRIAGEAEPKITGVMNDLPTISARLKTSAEHIEAILTDERTHQMLENMSTTAQLAPVATAEVRRTAQRLSALLASQQSDLETIIQQLRRTMDNIDRLSSEAEKNPSRILFGDPPPRVGPGGAGGSSAPENRR